MAFGTTVYKVITFTSVAERSTVRGAVTPVLPVLLRSVVARISKLDLLTIIQFHTKAFQPPPLPPYFTNSMTMPTEK